MLFFKKKSPASERLMNKLMFNQADELKDGLFYYTRRKYVV
ncbi:hypothetical protein [Paenibacillus sp. A14]